MGLFESAEFRRVPSRCNRSSVLPRTPCPWDSLGGLYPVGEVQNMLHLLLGSEAKHVDCGDVVWAVENCLGNLVVGLVNTTRGLSLASRA